jgi:hypothetical protein
MIALHNPSASLSWRKLYHSNDDQASMITLTGLDHCTFDHHTLINNLNN